VEAVIGEPRPATLSAMSLASAAGLIRALPGRAVRAARDVAAGRAPVTAVVLGTFTLRLATGITGSMLVYYYRVFPQHGGAEVSAFEVGLLGALFYASELVGSPLFGVLSDRLGHRRVMLVGPAFGMVAVVVTALTASLPVIAATRLLEGGSTAASVPSILGFIAFATAADEVLRGRAVARFEAATLAGLTAGIVAGGLLFEAFGPPAFLANAFVYLASFLLYRHGVPPSAEPEPAGRRHDAAVGLRRYLEILRGGHVWLLAPTWICINAVLGLFTSQTLFQLVREPDRVRRFPSQELMGGFSPAQLSIGLAIGGLLFFAGLLYWGGRFKSMRRTTIVLYGVAGGAVLLAAGLAVNHTGTASILLLLVLAAVAAGGLFVLAGATPAAIGLLADITEAYPDDRGAIMGMYSVFLGLGQIGGSLLGGVAAQRAGLDGVFMVSFVLLAVAVLPITRLRRYEHLVGGATSAQVTVGDA
jgi:MFS family permease